MKILKKYFNYIKSGKGRIFLILRKIIPWDNLLFNYLRKKKLLYFFSRNRNKMHSFSNSKIENSLFLEEKSFFSQHGEDGIFKHIFDTIGFKSRKCIEIGFGYFENNSMYLISSHNFDALMIDGQSQNVSIANWFFKKFNFKGSLATESWITKDNINSTISNNSVNGEIDMLSIDIDGNDYWIWESIDVVNPRLVIIEYNASFFDQSITVPYNEFFDRTNFSNYPTDSHWYHGASLKSLISLGEKKGYYLIGTESKGVNAFFLRKDICDEFKISKKDFTQAFKDHFSRKNGTLSKVPMSSEEQFSHLKNYEFVKI